MNARSRAREDGNQCGTATRLAKTWSFSMAAAYDLREDEVREQAAMFKPLSTKGANGRAGRLAGSPVKAEGSSPGSAENGTEHQQRHCEPPASVWL